jgi:hypothetical protein
MSRIGVPASHHGLPEIRIKADVLAALGLCRTLSFEHPKKYRRILTHFRERRAKSEELRALVSHERAPVRVERTSHKVMARE